MQYSQIYVSGPHEEHLHYWKNNGAYVTVENGKVAEEANIIFLAVKPHILAAAIANVYDTISTPSKVVNKLFISILAGVKLETLEKVNNCADLSYFTILFGVFILDIIQVRRVSCHTSNAKHTNDGWRRVLRLLPWTTSNRS